MGFEILPITDSDFLDGGVPKYDVFEITGPKQWIPARFRNLLHLESEKDEELYFFDPQDEEEQLPFQSASLKLDSDYVLSKDEPTNEVDAFLDCLSDKELVGIEVTNPEYYGYPPLDESLPTPDKHSCNQFNTFIYAITSWHRVLYDGVDPKHLQPFLGYRPLEIVKKP